MLSAEERNDLRRKVLKGESLTLDESRSVYESLRQGQGAAAIVAIDGSSKKGSKRKEGISDAALEADLSGLGL